MRDSHLHFGELVLEFLQPYGRKEEPIQALYPGLTEPS